MRKRILWIDILNIIACICVVWMHCTNNQIHNYNGEPTIEYAIGLITHTFAYWPVPVFFMLSGCNLMGYRGDWKEFYVKRMKRTLIPFIGWSLFYFIVNYHRIIPLQQFVELFVTGKFCPTMWFFIPLFSVYLCLPFISTFIQHASKRMLYAYLSIGFVTISLVPFIFDMLEWKYPNVFPIGMNYILLAVLGYALKSNQLFTNKNHAFYACIISCTIHIIILFFITNVQGKSGSHFLNCVYPFNLITSVCIFVIAQNTNWEKYIVTIMGISEKRIISIISCSLGVFLVHPFIITVSDYFKIGLANPYFGVITVYILSLLMTLTLKRIPVICKIVP